MKIEKIPSSLSLTNWLSPEYYMAMNFINLLIRENPNKDKSCGPTENRTLDFWVTTKGFTIKLLAHNTNNKELKYINI